MSVGFVVTVTSEPYREYIYIWQAVGSGGDIAMALIRIQLLLLLFAVSLSHVRPQSSTGEYFAVSCSEGYGSDRSLTGQSDHPLCT